MIYNPLHLNLAALRRETKQYGVYSLLSRPNANPKVFKNAKLGVQTSPLHLAPASLSGFNVCASSTPGCRAGCLHTAGNPVYMTGKEKSRIARTVLYFKNRSLFMALLQTEITHAVAKANREGMACAFRLNATSDIPWENVPIAPGRAGNDSHLPRTIIDFINGLGAETYDYTKRVNRKPTKGYHLTFSLAENNDSDAKQWLSNGGNVAVVFNTKRGAELPTEYIGYPVIDGDTSDYRPSDPAPCIVGLRAKGDAIGDKSGFVRSAS